MYLNLDLKHLAPKEKCDAEIYEFVSEAHITGSTDYFGGTLLISPLIETPEPHDLFTYQVKALFATEPEEPLNLDDASEDAYYHPGGIADELASLFALFYQARFYHTTTTGGEITERGAQTRTVNKIMRKRVPTHWDKKVFKGEGRNFTDFPAFLDKVIGLPEEKHLSIMKAASNYNSALRQIGLDPEMVFVKLVSAIEVLSVSYELNKGDDPLYDLGDISRFTIEQRAELKSLIKNRKTKRKFIRFIEEHSKGYFKGGKFNAPDLHIKRTDLNKVLSAIYDARSAYLHDGENMYLSTPFEEFDWDTDSSAGMYIGKRKFAAEKKLPYIHFFEDLVRYCILSYIDAQRSK